MQKGNQFQVSFASLVLEGQDDSTRRMYRNIQSSFSTAVGRKDSFVDLGFERSSARHGNQCRVSTRFSRFVQTGAVHDC